MTTGIYRLMFADGSTYIGKSIDVNKRWEQHFSRLEKGTAARPLQNAYYLYGLPTTGVLFECSPDHIDVAEAHFIARCKPNLNTQIPEDPMPLLDDVYEVEELLAMSTEKMLITIMNKHNEVVSLTNEVESIREQRNEEELEFDVTHRIINLCSELEETKSGKLAAEAALARIKSMSWWERLFYI